MNSSTKSLSRHNLSLNRGRIITFVAVFLIALLFLIPTFFKDSFSDNWISKPISLGLDLSGGVHLVYEVQTKEAVKSKLQGLANSIRSELRQQKIPVKRAVVGENLQLEISLLSNRSTQKTIDFMRTEYPKLEKQDGLSTDVLLVYKSSEADNQATESESVLQAIETLRNRVDQFGVAEPTIQKVGEKRILLQMPGVSDIESVKKVVGSVAKLEFRFLPKPGSSGSVSLKDRSGAPISVEDFSSMTGDAVDDARVGIQRGQVDVNLRFTSEGSRTFAKITGENVGRQLAIILDGVVYSNPVIRERIAGGSASISGGNMGLEEAKQLAVVLRAGALPAPLNVLEERTVGPTLGQESIEKGIKAILIGFIAIIIFMLIYYGKSGAVACLSLLLNLLLVMAALSAFGATLTLPGLAGLALTIGMAVDANVIIFERIREEVRNGSTRDAAVKLGFDKAFSAIVDSNLTTLLTGLILYYFGTGPIRGFAVTLSIGILSTLYCATFASRLIFDLFPLTGKKGLSI
ncbi:MAG: protein translocase subunit SecD [Bdellovibrionales bacterium]|nr:protein translocase subunit SecD [Bdellovibrionales bacterium]